MSKTPKTTSSKPSKAIGAPDFRLNSTVVQKLHNLGIQVDGYLYRHSEDDGSEDIIAMATADTFETLEDALEMANCDDSEAIYVVIKIMDRTSAWKEV